MTNMEKQFGVKVDAGLKNAVYAAIDQGIGEDASQIIRMAIREFMSARGISVKV